MIGDDLDRFSPREYGIAAVFGELMSWLCDSGIRILGIHERLWRRSNTGTRNHEIEKDPADR